MHLFHPKFGIKKYKSAEEILVDFTEIRIEFYKKRKAHQLAELTKRSMLLEDKARFIKEVVEETLIIFKRTRASIEEELLKKFLKVNGSFDHLLHIKTYQYTLEAIQELKDEATSAQKELVDLQKMSLVDLWKSDLN